MRSGQFRSCLAAARFAAPLALVASLAACSSGNSGSNSAASNGSCSGVSGTHHVRVVVDTGAGATQAHCVGFDAATIPALTALRDSKFELGTQQFSFGLAICQVANVPAHYSQCLPSNADYWGVFTSANGKPWVNPPVGISQITLHPGDSLGLRYDSPQGNPVAPPAPSPA